MDVFENEIGCRDLLEGIRLPKLQKVLDTSGIERVIDEQCVRDVYDHVRMIAVDHKYSCIDFNDIVTLLESGTSAIAVEVESGGLDRAERALAMLANRFRSADCPLGQVEKLILHFQFTGADHKPSFREYDIIEETLIKLLAEDHSMLKGFTDDGTGTEDSLTVMALAII